MPNAFSKPVTQSASATDSAPSRYTRHVFVRDLIVHSRIGVYDHEKQAAQRVRLNIDLAVPEPADALPDRLDAVVCYETIVTGVRAIATEGHTNLVETLAEKIAAFCLQDLRIASARIQVEKLDVFDDTASVGIAIERTQHEA